MNLPHSPFGKRLAGLGAAIGLWTIGITATHAQGIGFSFNSSSYTAVQGGSVSGTISMYAINNQYDTDPWCANNGYYTDWYVHRYYDAPSKVEISGTGIATNDVNLRWPANYYGSESFSLNIPANGSAGRDLSATLTVWENDPYDDDPWDSSVQANPYYYYCFWVYGHIGVVSAPITLLNPNTEFDIDLIGPETLVESASPQSTTIRIYRSDTYNTRRVYYSVAKTAVPGSDYTANLGAGYVDFSANGSSYVDIPVSTVTSQTGFSPRYLTVALEYDSAGTYEIGWDDSVTLTFEPDQVTTPGDTDPGTAQIFGPAWPSPNDLNISRSKNGSYTNASSTVMGSSRYAFVNVLATSPYATLAGPRPGVFTITRSGGTNAFTLNYAITGTAIAGSNYTALPASVSFAASQTTTNLLVNVLTNLPLASAQTVVLTLSTNGSYFVGYAPQAVVSLLPNSSLTNSVASPAGRSWRGSGSDPTYWSQVIPMDGEKGTVYSSTNGNCSTLYPGLSSWSSQMLYHYNATNSLSQTNTANRIAFNNPIVAFGERTGGSALYFGQPYHFGIYAGNPLAVPTNIVIQVYYRTNLQLAGSISVAPPKYTSASSMLSYATNGYAVSTNAFGLLTTLSDSPALTWGAASLGAYVLTHTATSQSTNYYYLVGVAGYPDSSTNLMVINSNRVVAPSLLFTLEFESRPPWRSLFVDHPQFNGSPLPPFYAGKTVAEMLTNTPPVTNVVNFTPSAATNLDNSPELRRHPILDQFVADMGNDPIALANYVLNSIELTDPMGYNDDGSIGNQVINPGGVSRGALGTFLEKQGSPVEQCALLVYLLRQAGVPAVYEFAPRNGLQILDARLSQMLKFQVHGAFSEAGQLYTTNTIIGVNYPWVAAYIGTNWVHVFPWLKDYEIVEGFNLYDYMPTNYPSAYPWVRDYIYGNTNLLSLAAAGDNTPGAIFPAYLKQTLRQNHPGVSVDDLGVQIVNRPHYYARWQDFPTPTCLTNTSTALESLASSSITNIDPALTNIFDMLSVEVYSVNNPTNDIKTGDLRLVDLHNREFYISQVLTNSSKVQLNLILLPFRTNITSQFSFADDTNLLSRQVLSMTLATNENQLSVRFRYRRNRAVSPAMPIDPTTVFFGFNAAQEIDLERPLWRGDQAAICLDYGRVTRDMIKVHAQDLWQMESALRANPSLTNSISADVYLGATMTLAGQAYYKKVGEFDQLNQNLNKVSTMSMWALGLSKISAARDSQGNLTNGVNPVLPNLDMFYYQTAEAGNGTVQADSGQMLQLAQQNYNLVAIANASAEEHHTLNHFYQQTNAVSTVRLLQLSQAGGTGIVMLNFSNYVAQGTNVYQGQQLQNWDPTLWTSVAGALNGSPYTIAYMTPGPMTNSAYKGMAALILGWNQWQALISPSSLNGAFGSYFPPDTFSLVNIPLFFFSDIDNPTLSLLPLLNGAQFANNFTADNNISAYYNQLLGGTYLFDPAQLSWNSTAASQYGLSLSGSVNQNYANTFLFTQIYGDLGTPNNGGSGLFNMIADPVHSVTGEFLVDETDLQLPGPMPLSLRRNYSSHNLADNQFGPGWKLSLMPYLAVSAGATNIFAADMDGAVLAYVRTNASTNFWVPTVAANPQINNQTAAGVGGLANRLRDRLVQASVNGVTNYTLYGADGSVRSFQVTSFNNGTTNLTRPYLQQWTDNRGNFYTFQYGTNAAQTDFGQVRRIQSSNGNYLGLYYDIYGHITEAYCGDGRRMYYEYDDYNDLVTVTLPDATSRSYVYQHGTQAVTNGVAEYSTHLIIEEDKPDGRVLQNAFDSQRRVTNQWSTAGADLIPVRTATFIYSNNYAFTNSWTNQVSGYTLIVDANNHTNRFDYTNGLYTKITDPLNHTIQQTWYPDNAAAPGYPRSVSQRIDHRGLVTQYQYDSNGNITNTTLIGDLLGNGNTNDVAVTSAIYNSNCLPLQVTDPVGNGVSTIYDPTYPFLPQQVIKYAGATGVSTNYFVYGNATNVVSNGNLLATNQAFGLMLRTIRAYGSASAATNDTLYNGQGYITCTVQYTGTGDPDIVNWFFYDERNELVQRTDAAGRNYLFFHDDMGRPTGHETFEAGQANPMDWSYQYYNDNGELNWVDGPRYNPEDYIYYDYDGAGRKTQEIHWLSQGNPDGTGVSAMPGYALYATTFYQYDCFGNLTNIVDPLGNYMAQSFDAAGQLVRQVRYSASGSPLSTNGFGYETGGQVSAFTNALGGVTQKAYTSAGKLKFQSNPDGSTNAWRFDSSGRVVQELLPNGNYWQTTYDDAHLTITRTFHNASGTLATTSTQFDPRGNVIQTVDPEGNAFSNTFDGLDRTKTVAGPRIESVSLNWDLVTYSTNITQQISTYLYDSSGQVLTVANVLGEKTVTTSDALGRPIQVAMYAPSNATPARTISTFYSPDHNSVTVTQGTGAGAIATTTFTDTSGHPVLNVGYPTNGVIEYVWQQYDVAGRRTASQQLSSTGGQTTVWATNGWTYNALNQLQTQTAKDGVQTTYGHDALGDVTSRSMPNGLSWTATYYTDGRIATEQETGGSLTTRTKTYSYYSSGSPFAGRLQTVTDGRGTTRTYNYDDYTRLSTLTTSGSLAEQQTSATYQYDRRNLLLSLTQSYNSTNTGPATDIERQFDSYGQLSDESVSVGDEGISYVTHAWDAGGRRTSLSFGSQDYGFQYQAGLMTAADGSRFGYGDNGLLTGRTNNYRAYAVTQRDGMGRALQTTTTVGFSTVLTESLTWRNDGRLAAYTANRAGDFTDSRSYTYAPWSQRLTQEIFNVSASQKLTNNYTFDNGQASGLGTLTSVSTPAQSANAWSVSNGGLDGLNRVASEQTAILRRPATGLALGAGSVSATLNGKPVNVQFDGSDAEGRWRAMLDLAAATNTLLVTATHPSGLYAAYATNTFTTGGGTDTVTNAFDANGNVTQRVWRNSLGQTTRTQTFTWDAFDRLIKVSDRDAVGSGQDWGGTFDGLGRKVRTITTLVVSNTPITSPADAISKVDSWFDPLVEFQEVGVVVNGGVFNMKTYGPDANGVYGGLQGVGGLERITPYGHITGVGLIQDFFGNVIGSVTNRFAGVAWNPARFCSIGPVPGYQPPALTLNANLTQSVGWRGKHMEAIGTFHWGARPYEPASGRFLAHDPVFDPLNPGGFSACAGDMLNGFDPDGRFGKAVGNQIISGLSGFADLVGPGYTMAVQAQYPTAGNFDYQPYMDLQQQQIQAIDNQFSANLKIQDGSYFNAANMTFNPLWNAATTPFQLDTGLSLNTATFGQNLDYQQKVDVTASGFLSFVNTATLAYGVAKPIFCFPAGTKVLMADGSAKAIEDIEPGENVFAADPGNAAEPRTVFRTHTNWTQRLIHIAVDENGDGVADGELQATGEHPIWTQNRGWTDAVDLRAGDRLLDAQQGEPVVLSAVSVPTTCTTYNLSVEGSHTFFVIAGQAPVLVHNTDIVPQAGQVGTMGTMPPAGNFGLERHEILNARWLDANGYGPLRAGPFSMDNPAIYVPEGVHRSQITPLQRELGLGPGADWGSMSAEEVLARNYAILEYVAPGAGLTEAQIQQVTANALNHAQSLPTPCP